MVTIEQKLALFSKLLQQDIKDDMTEKFLAIEKEYEELVKQRKNETDKQAIQIIEKARHKAKIKQTELISKAKIEAKKEGMLAKEKYISLFMKALKEKILDFTNGASYQNYLIDLVKQCDGIRPQESSFNLYLSAKDKARYAKTLKEAFEKRGIKQEQLQIIETSDNLLGGFVLKEANKNTRMDFSIAALLEEHQEQITALVLKAIEGAGETDE